MPSSVYRHRIHPSSIHEFVVKRVNGSCGAPVVSCVTESSSVGFSPPISRVLRHLVIHDRSMDRRLQITEKERRRRRRREKGRRRRRGGGEPKERICGCSRRSYSSSSSAGVLSVTRISVASATVYALRRRMRTSRWYFFFSFLTTLVFLNIFGFVFRFWCFFFGFVDLQFLDLNLFLLPFLCCFWKGMDSW